MVVGGAGGDARAPSEADGSGGGGDEVGGCEA